MNARVIHIALTRVAAKLESAEDIREKAALIFVLRLLGKELTQAHAEHEAREEYEHNYALENACGPHGQD